ncbi:hypothetical protein [Dendronalium sp. ChiSLP03b]|nr:hypothetical protein [Dendronalium sp. ChiSLP03b]MDZ8203774.1 hypothetical protein [Dendronalium sp. ChiSLP03b]
MNQLSVVRQSGLGGFPKEELPLAQAVATQSLVPVQLPVVY